MFYEYALEPKLISTWASFRYFTEKFGWAHGRLIVEYPKRWRRMVYECLDCGDVERKRIVEKMRFLTDRTVRRRGAPYDRAVEWLTNALAEHDRQPFYAIIAAENPGQSEAVITEDDSEEGTLVAPPGIVPRKPKEIAQAISLMVRAARRVILADPYFAPDKPRFRRVLEAIVAEAGPGTEFVIHTSIDRWFALDEERETDIEDRVAGELRKLFEARHFTSILPDWCSVQVCIWKRRAGGDRFHNRYVFTELGGIIFGTGLDVPDGDAAETDDLNRLAPEQHAIRMGQFVDAPAFDLACATFEVRRER